MIEFRENPIPTARQSCRQIAIKRIADTIRELEGSGEPVTEEAFVSRGIPATVVARYGKPAAEAARRSSVKQV